MNGVARLDDHGPIALRVIGEDFVGHRVAGHETAHDACTGDGRCSAFAAVGNVAQAVGRVVRARATEVPCEHPEQPLQVAHQRGMPVHLHTEVLEYGD